MHRKKALWFCSLMLTVMCSACSGRTSTLDASAPVDADADADHDAEVSVDADDVGVPDVDIGVDSGVDAAVDADNDVEVDSDTAIDWPARAALAQCLTASGAVLYSTDWCTYCYLQERLFGDYAVFLTVVDCWDYDHGEETQQCTDLGITSYPTWIFGDGTHVGGLQNFAQLAAYSGCPWE